MNIKKLYDKAAAAKPGSPEQRVAALRLLKAAPIYEAAGGFTIMTVYSRTFQYWETVTRDGHGGQVGLPYFTGDNAEAAYIHFERIMGCQAAAEAVAANTAERLRRAQDAQVTCSRCEATDAGRQCVLDAGHPGAHSTDPEGFCGERKADELPEPVRALAAFVAERVVAVKAEADRDRDLPLVPRASDLLDRLNAAGHMEALSRFDGLKDWEDDKRPAKQRLLGMVARLALRPPGDMCSGRGNDLRRAHNDGWREELEVLLNFIEHHAN